MPSTRTKVEVKGLEAKHYDLLMDLLTFGRYEGMIRRIIGDMGIRPGDAIVDLGSGTGRNDCMMLEHTGPEGRILGLDVGEEMMAQAVERCKEYPNVSFLFQRIEEPWGIEEEFDKAFMSFVLHGFEDYDKARIMDNVYRALKPGGEFFILDYNEFDLEKQFFLFRWIFKKGECPLASEFVALDLKKMLADHGFGDFDTKTYAWGYIRLLRARKVPAG
jgi:demethylmenaquinone methyltransferase/2-methoxy-6-polyprenyl-1,4-benzoquinol methylase